MVVTYDSVGRINYLYRGAASLASFMMMLTTRNDMVEKTTWKLRFSCITFVFVFRKENNLIL